MMYQKLQMRGGKIMKEKELVKVENVDTEKKAKAMFVLKCKGKKLSQAVREMIDSLAEEYDNMEK